LDQTLHLLEENAKKNDITLKAFSEESLKAFADPDQLLLILRNLLSNALKYTKEGGTVTVTASSISDREVLIQISDTGKGMTPQQLDQLFDYTTTASERGLHGESGTGLGLILTKETVEANGGTLKIDSISGEGTTVRVVLPSVKNQQEQPELN
jgi:signal transduction histidine kinase